MRGITSRAVGLVVASALGGVLLAPVAPMAADDPPAAESAPAGATAADDAAPAPAPRAALSVAPARPVAGAPVRLDARGSSGPIASYSWDLDGDGSFETSTGSRAAVQRALAVGKHRVAVRVADAGGRSDDADAELTVAEPPPAAETQAPQAGSHATLEPAHAAPAAAEPSADEPRHSGAARQPEPRLAGAPRLRAASGGSKAAQPAAVHASGSSSVTIQSFAFSPSTIDVSVGDTVTWTNQDPTAHTATGSGGSFDTGTLKKGESGSHTFQSAGSFSYICSIHPSMKGTVVVTGASSGGSGGSGGSGSGGSAGGSTSTPSASGGGGGSGALPHTGLVLLAVVLTGAAMTGSGMALRLLLSVVPGRGDTRG